MLEQAIDFKDESEALYAVIAPLSTTDWKRESLFKSWTLHDVIGHLHVWNYAADLALHDEGAFGTFIAGAMEALAQPNGMRTFTNEWLDGLTGPALGEAWREFFVPMSERFALADPKQRVKWAGPDMSVRSSITARLMETWTHGQEVYDLFGLERVNGDRIKNICVLGVNTFGWTFANRDLPEPPEAPPVRRHAPSGALWEWKSPSDSNRIEGAAEEFCQVVTQVRNIADTDLQVSGPTAIRWMEIAQCFAGAPEDPPAAGARRRQV